MTYFGSRPGALPLYRLGDALTVRNMNEPRIALNELRGLEPPRDSGEGIEATRDESNPDPLEDNATAERWKFVSKRTRSIRVESASDPNVYVDVLITTSVTVRTETQQLITIEFEEGG